MTPPPENGSVSILLSRLKDGDRKAVEALWKRYFPRLVGLARVRLQGRPRPIGDEEDLALIAFESFCRRAEEGLFPLLKDRDSLWALLVVMVARKVADALKYDGRGKRESGPIVAIDAGDSTASMPELVSDSPTPFEAAVLAEEVDSLLKRLSDESLRQVAVWKLEGYSNADIAARQKCSIPTVERRLALIRRLLHQA